VNWKLYLNCGFNCNRWTFCPLGSQHQNTSIAVLTVIDGFFAREVEKCPGRAREGDECPRQGLGRGWLG